MTPKALSSNSIVFFIVGLVIALMGLYLTYDMYKNCDGVVVRGLWGLVCISN